MTQEKDADKLIKLIKEFYPYIKREVIQAIEMGPAPEGHQCHPTCQDCEWYNRALIIQKRIDQGEFNEFDS
jgi:hypothetical protein